MVCAKRFLSGRSQAVRLPKASRFEGLINVCIEHDGDCVSSAPAAWPPSSV